MIRPRPVLAPKPSAQRQHRSIVFYLKNHPEIRYKVCVQLLMTEIVGNNLSEQIALYLNYFATVYGRSVCGHVGAAGEILEPRVSLARSFY